MIKKLIWPLASLFFLLNITSLTAQKKPVKLPMLVINEVHNENIQNDDFYIELLVVKSDEIAYNPYDDAPKVIIDDSNEGHLFKPGFLAIKPEAFVNARPGDLIVLHGSTTNVSGVNPEVLLLDINSGLIEKYIGTPNSQNSSYVGATQSNASSANFKDFMSFNGPGNIIQVRVNEVFFNKVNQTNDNNISLNGNEFNLHGPLGPTIGSGNNDPNDGVIDDLNQSRNFKIDCEPLNNTFSASVEITDGRSPYELVVNSDNPFVTSGSPLTAYGLQCGINTITVTDKGGLGLEATCEISIDLESPIKIFTCGCENVDLTDYLCKRVESDCIALTENNMEPIPLTSFDDIPIIQLKNNCIIDEPYPVSIQFGDGDGGIISEVAFEIIAKDPNITPAISEEVVPGCPKAIKLTADNTYDSYSWTLNGIPISIANELTASISGDYALSVNGCGSSSVSTTVLIEELTANISYVDNTKVLYCNEEIALEALSNVTPVQYAWYSGDDLTSTNIVSTEEIYSASPGAYSLVVTDPSSGCTARSSITIYPVVAEREFLVSPKNPGLCGGQVEVKVKGDVDTHSWTLPLSSTPEPDCNKTSEGLVCTLFEAGAYELQVVDENGCSKDLSIEVDDLDDAAGIKAHLEKTCFYSVPILINPDTRLAAKNIECELRLPEISLNATDYFKLQNFDVELEFLDEFKATKGKDLSYLLTENRCLCSSSLKPDEEDLEDNLRVHIWYEDEESEEGLLYIRANTAWNGYAPKAKHKDHIEGLSDLIKAKNGSNEEIAKVLFGNAFMSHRFDGFEDAFEECAAYNATTSTGEQKDYLLTPGYTAIKFGTDVSSVKFIGSEKETEVLTGCLGSFSDATNNYTAYYKPFRGEGEEFHGYYDDISGQFYEEFLSKENEVAYSIGLPSDCEGVCSMIAHEYTDSDDNFNDGADGGFEQNIITALSSSDTDEDFEDWVLDLLCAVKSKDDYVEYEDLIYSDRIIFLKNVYLGDKRFELLGLTMPPRSELSGTLNRAFLADPIGQDKTGQLPGFENSIYLDHDKELRVSLFEFIDSEDTLSVGTTYTVNEWGAASASLLNCKIQPVSNEELLELIQLKEEEYENLLIFVNGYRPVDGAGILWGSNEPVDIDEKPRTCFDDLPDTGPYWNEWGAKAQSGNTKNTLFVDGHENISSSNHYNRSKFAASAVPCLYEKNVGEPYIQRPYEKLFKEWQIDNPPPLGGYFCDHNGVFDSELNKGGFIDRYDLGLKSGNKILDQIQAGRIKVKLNADQKIIGKIDVICHSFGFAHASGMIEALRTGLAETDQKLGYFYIFAPENPASLPNALEPDLFDEVWQYGSDETEALYLQDGVAHQKIIAGLERNQTYLTEDWFEIKLKNFLDAHYIANYTRMFENGFSRHKLQKRN